MPSPDISKWKIAYEYLDQLIRDETPGSVGELLIQTEEGAYSAWNLAALSPWMSIVDPPNANRKANAPPPVAVAAREGFRAPNKLTDIITASYRNRSDILCLKQAVCNRESFINERDRFGMAIRRWDAPMGSWRLQVLSAMLVEALEVLPGWSIEYRKGK
jgi:tRNA nucleotidyltransferase (CCA-adding enzyme)